MTCQFLTDVHKVLQFFPFIVSLQDGVNILAVNYGSPGACQYPRQLKLVSWDQPL